MKKCVKRRDSKFTYNDNKKKLVGLNENKIKILISGVKYELFIIIVIEKLFINCLDEMWQFEPIKLT
jgi:hypothetical protein